MKTSKPVKWLAALLLTYAIAFPAMAVASSSPGFALFSSQMIERLKSEASTKQGEAMIKSANAGLSKAPDPLPRVHTEGTLPHQGIHDQSLEAKRDWQLMLTFGFAYRLTGDQRYLQAEERLMSAWLDTYQISFNPIDETNLDQLILAYDLTAASLSPATQNKMTRFLHTMAEGYLTKIAEEKREDVANWQSHRIKLITLASYALGDTNLINRARQAFQRQVSVNIHPDGSVVDFFKRDALHYVVYDLEPLTTAALAAKAHGEDWFHAKSSGQSSVEKAIDWLTPYAMGQKTHEEFVHSSVRFDAQRAQAGLKGYSGRWDPITSVDLYQLATLADPKYPPVVQQLIHKTERDPQDWLILVSHTGVE